MKFQNFYPLFDQIFKRSHDGQFTKRHRRIISTISVISHTEKRAKTLGFKILKRVRFYCEFTADIRQNYLGYIRGCQMSFSKSYTESETSQLKKN